jgi:hypothetical protein
MTWMHGTEWPDSATWRWYLTSAMHRYSCCRNGVHMVLGQVLRDTASRLGTQILPLEVCLLPGMAKTNHNIFQTLSHIYDIFSEYKMHSLLRKIVLEIQVPITIWRYSGNQPRCPTLQQNLEHTLSHLTILLSCKSRLLTMLLSCAQPPRASCAAITFTAF